MTKRSKAKENGHEHREASLADLSLETLKAMCYDELVIVQARQANLQALNQEIARRATAAHTAADRESAV